MTDSDPSAFLSRSNKSPSTSTISNGMVHLLQLYFIVNVRDSYLKSLVRSTKPNKFFLSMTDSGFNSDVSRLEACPQFAEHLCLVILFGVLLTHVTHMSLSLSDFQFPNWK